MVIRRYALASAGVLDSAVSSASNFLLSGMALVLLDTQSDFARVTVFQAAHVLLIALVRANFGEALIIRWPTASTEVRARSSSEALWGVLLVTGLAAGVTVLAGAALSSLALVVFGFGLVPLCLADAVRYDAFARQRVVGALRVDVAWLIVQGIVTAGLALTGTATVWSLLLAWILGAAAGFAAGQQGLIGPRDWRGGIRWFGRDRSLRAGLLVDAISSRAAPSVSVMVAAAVLSFSEVADITGPRALFGPVNILFAAALSLGLAAAARRNSGAELAGFISRLGAGMAAPIVGVLVVLLAIGGWLSENLDTLDGSGLNLRFLLIAGALLFTAGSNAMGVGFRSQGLTSTSGRVQAVSGLLLVTCTFFGAIAGGAVGALVGQLVARGAACSIWLLMSTRTPGPMRTAHVAAA